MTGAKPGLARGRTGATGLETPGWRGTALRSVIVLRRPTAPLRRLPEVLLVGGQRCGTTSLYRYLAAHPAVRGPRIKEPKYFAQRYDRGLGWYRSLFPIRRTGVISFDASPYYLFHPLAPVRAADAVPDATVIALVRDPLERAFSHYKHSVRLGVEDRTFEEAIELEATRLAGENERILADPTYDSTAHRWHSYASRGLYAMQLRRWHAAFPAERVLVVRSEDLFAEPAATHLSVQGFLGLDSVPLERYDVFTQSSKNDADSMSASVRDRLRDYFAGPNQELETMLGRSLHWH